MASWPFTMASSTISTRRHGMRTRSKAFRWMSLPAEIRLMMLLMYGCRQCKRWGGDYQRQDENTRMINEAASQPFDMICTWRAGNALTLELNAHSASDSKHWFRNCYFSSTRT
ncbi:hypothetical protein QBC43DRAFT_17302 [Cladorrhinum sp. PSN259]|nr:hypothetical protein QBC43DRAFT_17302 [Cladorrhinum sp. PSN259]